MSTLYCWQWQAEAAQFSLIPIPVVWTPSSPGPRDSFVEVVLRIEGNDSSNTKCAAVVSDVKSRELAKDDLRGNFMGDIAGDNFAADLVHCYTVARLALEPFLSDKEARCSDNIPRESNVSRHDADFWSWAFGSAPLRIVAHAGERQDSCYNRTQRCLKFFHVNFSDGRTYFCRSFDIVAHETGHAILDALNSRLYSSKVLQVAAFHEAFADLVAIFTVLSVDCLAIDVLRRCNGDLRKADFVTAMGARVGSYSAANAALSDTDRSRSSTDEVRPDAFVEESEETVRNLNNRLRGSTTSRGVYTVSSLFSGFVWDVLVDLFVQSCELSASKHHSARREEVPQIGVLKTVVTYVRRIVSEVATKFSADDLTFHAVAHLMSSMCCDLTGADFSVGKKATRAVIESRAREREFAALNTSRARYRASLLGDF